MTCKGLVTDISGVKNREAKGSGASKLKEQKESQCGYRPMKEGEGDRREGRQELGQVGPCEQ